MVKMSGFDNLKKMGSDLLNSAKALKFDEMVDKVKSGVESVGGKRVVVPQGDEAIKESFQQIHATLSELIAMQTAESTSLKKLQGQISDLARIIEASQQPKSETVTATVTVETDTNNQSDVKEDKDK